MEHGPDDRKHYGESKLNYNLFRHRNKLRRMFEDSFGNSFRWFLYNSDCQRITGIYLCRRIKYAHR